MDALLSKLKTFDAYPKTLDDFRVKTYAGAAGTPPRDGVCNALLAAVLTNASRCRRRPACAVRRQSRS